MEQNILEILSRNRDLVSKFISVGELAEQLYEDLFNYYCDNNKIPYGVAKARTGDPFLWVSNQLNQEISYLRQEYEIYKTIFVL